jgi:hypothetical protein
VAISGPNPDLAGRQPCLVRRDGWGAETGRTAKAKPAASVALTNPRRVMPGREKGSADGLDDSSCFMASTPAKRMDLWLDYRRYLTAFSHSCAEGPPARSLGVPSGQAPARP